MFLNNIKARIFTQEPPVCQCVVSSANILCFEVVLPRDGRFPKRSGLCLSIGIVQARPCPTLSQQQLLGFQYILFYSKWL